MLRNCVVGAVVVGFLGLCGAACNRGSEEAKPAGDQPKPTETQAAAAQTGAAAGGQNKAGAQSGWSSGQTGKAEGTQAAGNDAAKPAPAATGYDLSAIKAIPDNCSSPKVLLATAPKSVGADYAWNTTRQAMLANQQFRVVMGAPAIPGQVSLNIYEYGGNAFGVVAVCNDGGTCNQLAAMYKAIVRTSNPQVVCGPLPGISASPVASFKWDANPTGNLPADKDVGALCARLDACMIATDRSTPGDPFVECQKAPSSFKTECARRYPCAEVMACMGK